MNIGEAAGASGISAKMIRHYERIGLLAQAQRTDSNYRVYGERDVAELRFIRRARALGFSLDHIGLLLDLWRDRGRASADVKELALGHLKALEERIADLQAMRRTLHHLAAGCHGDDRPDCPILDDLAGEGEPGSEPHPEPHLVSSVKRPSQSAAGGAARKRLARAR